MPRVEISTTVDRDLLHHARSSRTATDAALIDEALQALLAADQASEVNASYAAHDVQPLDAPDAWGDVESWRRAAGAS